jgi:hypothetical protein
MTKNITSKKFWHRCHSSGKQRPWSKLQKELYDLIDEKINFQIHCVAHRMKRASNITPTRYWITLDKETLWDYPQDFVEKYTSTVQCRDGSIQEFNESRLVNTKGEKVYGYPYGCDVTEISDTIRKYIDTPKDELFEKEFESDNWGLTDILKAADRRIGKQRLEKLKDKTDDVAAHKIIAQRVKKPTKGELLCQTL